MPAIFLYFLKLSLSLSVVYLFYRLVLRRLTFYNWNRFYLVVYSALSFFIPFVNITPVLQRNEMISNQAIQFIPSVNAINNAANAPTLQHNVSAAISSWDWVLLFIACGSIILLGRLLGQLLSLQKIVNKARLISDDTIKLYEINQTIIPFSFGNSIFINRDLHDENELAEIIRHEFVHIRQRHTIDILFSELLCIINWYNPFAWLIRKAIRQNLEFIADDKVLQSGMDKKQYQYLLLKVTGNNYFSIAQNFNFSSLKKRIAMMNKMKSARVHLLQFLFIAPILAIILVSFRDIANDKKNDQEANALSVNTTIPSKTFVNITERDTVPGPQSTASERDFMIRHPNVKKITWEYLGSDSASWEDAASGKEGDRLILLHFASGKPEVYNLAGAGDIERFKKSYGEMPPKQVAHIYSNRSDANLQNAPNPNSIELFESDKKPLIVVDGKEQAEGDDLNAVIAPDDIDNIRILKKESAINAYGEKGRNGVVIISSKEYAGRIVEETKPGFPVEEVRAQPVAVGASGVIVAEEKPKEVLAAASPVKELPGKPSAVATTKPGNGKKPSIPVSESKPVKAGKIATTSVSPEREVAGERRIIGVIKSTMTESEVKKVEADLKNKGYDFKIEKMEYKRGRLILLKGSISRDNDKKDFSASDFTRIMITEGPEKDSKDRFIFQVEIQVAVKDGTL